MLGQGDQPLGECTGYCAYKKQKDAEDDARWADYQKNPQRYAAICNGPHDREYADLCQQWRMAEGVSQQVKWAKNQFSITIFEVFFLIAAFGASSAAVFVSVRTSRRELRAYMGHLGAHFENLLVPGGMAEQGGAVKYFEKNSGQTPALKTRMYRHIIKFNPGEAPPIPDERLCSRIPLVEIVHPGQNFGSIVGAERASDTFLLYGFVLYEDIFERRWKRRFAFTYDASRKAGIEERWQAYEGHNDESDITPPYWRRWMNFLCAKRDATAA